MKKYNKNMKRNDRVPWWFTVALIVTLVALPSALLANYSGGRILNSDQTYSGEISIVDERVDGESGLVEVSDENVNTILSGNIRIDNDFVHTTTNDPIYSHGVRSTTDTDSIFLNTVNPTDRIVINVGGFASSGVRVAGAGVVHLDASAYAGFDKAIEININNTTTTAGNNNEGAAIYAGAGGVVVKGDIAVSARQARGYGLWTGGSAFIDLYDNVDIATYGAGGYGIRADGGDIYVRGNLNIETFSTGYSSGTLVNYYSYGINARYGANIVVDGATSISTVGLQAHGVFAGDTSFTSSNPAATVTLNGDVKIALSGSSAYGLYAKSSNDIVTLNAAGDISTVSHAVYTGTNGAQVHLNGATDIRVSGNTASGLYSAGGTISSTSADLAIASTGTGAAHAIYATGSSARINLAGIQSLSLNGTGDAIRAASGGKVYGEIGHYVYTGTMTATGSNSNITIHFAEESYYKGKTSVASNGTMDLSLSDSTWEMLANTSTLTTLELADDATLIMTIYSPFSTGYSNLSLRDFTNDSTGIIEIVLDSYDPVLNDTFYLVNASNGILGDTFFDFSRAALEAGLTWDTSMFAIDGSIRVTSVPIPEPSTVLPLGMGLAYIAEAYRRYRKKHDLKTFLVRGFC